MLLIYHPVLPKQFFLYFGNRDTPPDGVSCNGVDIVEVFFVTYWCGL